MRFRRAQNILIVIWLSGSGIAYALGLARTLAGFYTTAQPMWEWLMPNTMPTLLLIVGAVATRQDPKRKVDARQLYVAASLSVLFVAAVLVMSVGATSDDALSRLSSTNLVLGPLQGLVSLALGVFFVTSGRR